MCYLEISGAISLDASSVMQQAKVKLKIDGQVH
jgi:hypothetical protein